MSDRILEWVVKGTLYLLGAFSVATWAVVALKAVQAARARRQNRAFAASFGGVGGPAYMRMMADIEQRIAALPLYR